MKNCPYCGRVIWSETGVCRFCGIKNNSRDAEQKTTLLDIYWAKFEAELNTKIRVSERHYSMLPREYATGVEEWDDNPGEFWEDDSDCYDASWMYDDLEEDLWET